MWLAIAALTVADLVISNLAGRMTIDFDLPPQGFVGHTTAFTVGVRPQKGVLPRKIEIRLDLALELVVDEIRWLNPASGAGEGEVKASLDLHLTRRGRYAVNELWLKWPSRLKLLEIIARMLQPVINETIAESSYRRIRADIIFGRLTPGQKLKLESLKESYETSISTLREVLNRLSSEGLVVAEGQKGFEVSPVSVSDLKETAALRLLLETHGPRQLR